MMQETTNAVLDLNIVFDYVSSHPATFPNIYPMIRKGATGTCRPELNACYGPQKDTLTGSCTYPDDYWKIRDANTVEHYVCTYSSYVDCMGVPPFQYCSTVNTSTYVSYGYPIIGKYYIPETRPARLDVYDLNEAKALLNALPNYSLLYELPNGSVFGDPFKLSDMRNGFSNYTGAIKNITDDPDAFSQIVKDEQKYYADEMVEFAESHFPFNVLKTFTEWVSVFTGAPTAPKFNLTIGSVTYAVIDLSKYDEFAAFMRWMIGSYIMLLVFHRLRNLFLGIEGNSENV